MTGWIGSPFALTPFGTGTPATADDPPPGPPTGARYLNPSTRDYEADSYGQLARMPSVRQRILISVTTLFKSSSVLPKRGVKLPGKITPDFEQQCRNDVLEATADIVASGDATIDAIQVLVTQVGRAVLVISFTDLTTGQQDVLSVIR